VRTRSALNHVPETSAMLPGEWTLNPYRGCTHACAYCYARPTHEHLGFSAGADFEQQIVVKTNVAAVLRQELARKRVLPSRVALGTNTDPYQRAEGRYRLMPGIIEALRDAGVPFSILTKGTLIRADLPLLAEAAQRVRVELGVSVSLLDDDLQASIEPGTPTTAARLATVRAIRDAGLDCTVFAAPILPLLTDSDERIDALIGDLAAAGATGVLPTVLYLRGPVRGLVLAWLRRTHPRLVPEYERLYATSSRTPPEFADRIRRSVEAALLRHGLPLPTEETSDRFALHGRPKRAVQLPPTLF
jgi:DNA repair photolyase